MSHPYQSTALAATLSASQTNATLVPAVTGARIRVMAVALEAAAASTLSFGSGTTAITGSMTMPSGPFILPYNPDGWFVTAIGQALTYTSGTGALAGVIDYVTL